MNPYKIAIILTTFNGERYLSEQLKSLILQEGVNIDVFVYDDKSNDKTLQIVNKFREELNISIHVNIVNSGGTGKNILVALRDFDFLSVSKYQFFALCDQDDIWEKNKIIRAVKKLENSKADLYCSNLSMWNPKDGIIGTIKKTYPQKEFDYLFEGGSAGCTYVMSSKFVADLQKKLKEFPIEKKKRVSHDWLLYFLARIGNFNVVIDDNSNILYRIHDESQYGHLSKISLSSLRKRIALIRDGFYIEQISNNLQFIEPDSIEYKIYDSYTKSISSRIYILLFYNFSLMRKKTKFLVFFFLSIFFVKTVSLQEIVDNLKKEKRG